MFKQRWNQWLDQLGLRVSSLDALPQLCMLAIPVGLLSGGVIIAFRMLIETSQGVILPGGDIENYEGLAIEYRLLLPVAGGLLIGLVWQWLSGDTRQMRTKLQSSRSFL